VASTAMEGEGADLLESVPEDGCGDQSSPAAFCGGRTKRVGIVEKVISTRRLIGSIAFFALALVVVVVVVVASRSGVSGSLLAPASLGGVAGLSIGQTLSSPEIEVRGAGLAAVNGIYDRMHVSDALWDGSYEVYLLQDKSFELRLYTSASSWGPAWYFMRVTDALAPYVRHLDEDPPSRRFDVPSRGWEIYDGSLHLHASLPAPEIVELGGHQGVNLANFLLR